MGVASCEDESQRNHRPHPNPPPARGRELLINLTSFYSATETPKRETHPGLVAISVMLATIMQALDTTIANVALPHMQGSLAATQDQISWVLTSYIVAAAIAMPATGFIAAKIGRKRLC